MESKTKDFVNQINHLRQESQQKQDQIHTVKDKLAAIQKERDDYMEHYIVTKKQNKQLKKDLKDVIPPFFTFILTKYKPQFDTKMKGLIERNNQGLDEDEEEQEAEDTEGNYDTEEDIETYSCNYSNRQKAWQASDDLSSDDDI